MPEAVLFVTSFLLLLVWSVNGQIQVRLVNGPNAAEGRLEVLFQNQWGTVCDDGWLISNDNAGVVCRMLGFTGEARGMGAAKYGQGSDPIWLSAVQCDGNEATLQDCRLGGWGNSGCTHAEDVGVLCLGERVSTTTTTTPGPPTTTLPPRICNTPSPDVRLVDGGAEYVGRVQVRRQNVWGEVCDDFWGVQNARVICRMLCYNPDNARAHLGPVFGNVTEPYLLDDVQCLGNETDIFTCGYAQPIGSNNCGETEGAGVSCMQDTPTVPPLPEPVVICADNHVTAQFSRAGSPGLVAAGLTLSNGQPVTCGYTNTEDATSISINVPFVKCGTSRTDNATHMTYHARVQHSVTSGNQVITREQVFHIDVYCSLPRVGDPNNEPDSRPRSLMGGGIRSGFLMGADIIQPFSVHPDNEVEPVERTAPPQFGSGRFDTNMYLYSSDRFRVQDRIQSFPAPITLGDWVYVGISLKSPDPSLKVVVPRCWTTPDQDPTTQPQYDLIRNRCRLEPSITFYPINETMFAFRFQSFKFQGNHSFIYIHCKAFVCDLSEKHGDCDRSCSPTSSSGRRKKRDVSEDDAEIGNAKASYRVDKGPLVLLEKSGPQQTISVSNIFPTTTYHTGIKNTPSGSLRTTRPSEPGGAVSPVYASNPAAPPATTSGGIIGGSLPPFEAQSTRPPNLIGAGSVSFLGRVTTFGVLIVLLVFWLM